MFKQYQALFEFHGYNSYRKLENGVVLLHKVAAEIKQRTPNIKKIDLLAELDNENLRADAKSAIVLLHLYLTQKVSNAVAETLGRLGNII